MHSILFLQVSEFFSSHTQITESVICDTQIQQINKDKPTTIQYCIPSCHNIQRIIIITADKKYIFG